MAGIHDSAHGPPSLAFDSGELPPSLKLRRTAAPRLRSGRPEQTSKGGALAEAGRRGLAVAALAAEADTPIPEEEPPNPTDPTVPVEEPPGTDEPPTKEPPAGPDEVDPPIQDPRVPGQPSRKQVD